MSWDPVVPVFIPYMVSLSPSPIDLVLTGGTGTNASLNVGSPNGDLSTNGINGNFIMQSPDGMSIMTYIMNQ